MIVIITWLPVWKLFAPKITLLQLLPSSDTSSAERKIVEREWEPGEKPPNPMRKTEEENQKINKNILAP